MSKILGIDYGQSKVGLALADMETKTAVPLTVVDLKDLEPKIQDLIKFEEIKKIIVGLPLGMNGQETPQTKEALAFINQIKSIFKIEVIAEDERLTSVQAQSVGKDDAVAAMYILQSYLDRIN
jgi:putative Holliday junction resolvase